MQQTLQVCYKLVLEVLQKILFSVFLLNFYSMSYLTISL